MKRIIYLLMLSALASSCTQPEVGFISDKIHSLADTTFVPRGVFFVSSIPSVEGSTYPMEWAITGITDKNGNPTNELQEKHEIVVWTSAFDPKTDTTLELAMKKVKISQESPIIMNPISGEFVFTQATKFVPSKDFDINISTKNVKGEREVNKFTHVTLTPFVPVEIKTEMRSRLQLGKGGGVYDIGYNYSVVNDNDPKVPSVLNGTNPYITITKISDEPKMAVKVKMIIADSHGAALDPKKVGFNYSDDGLPLQNYHDNTIGVVVDSESSTFGLPAPPFPQYARNYKGNDSYLMYYLTTTDAFTVDKASYEAANGKKDWTPYTDPTTGQIRNRAYIRFGMKINDSGTWLIKMKVPYTTKK